MSVRQCTGVPRRGGVVVAGYQRQPFHWWLVDELGSVGDIRINLVNGDVDSALRLRRRFEQAMWLLDDLGWEQETKRRSFELTMPADELRPYLERMYWESVGSLAERPHELVEEAREQLQALTEICPSLLTRIAETDRRGRPAVSSEDTTELLTKLVGLVERLEGQVGEDD